MADDPTPRSGIRVLDLSTPRPPGQALPAPAPEPEAAPVPRGPAPVVGTPVDLSTGKAPTGKSAPRTKVTEGLRIVVQKTINLSTPKSEKAAPLANDGEPRSRRGTRPDAPRDQSESSGRGASRGGRKGGGSEGGGPKGGGGSKGGRRGGPKGSGRPRGDRNDGGRGRGGGAPSGQAPRSASSGLADFLDPETLKKLRGG